jgi:hypothetical protein
MKRPSSLALLFLAVLFCGGCANFHIPFIGKRTTPPGPMGPKDTGAIATETEKDFRQRWIDKRAGELVAQGQPSDAAHAQALSEFDQRYAALTIVQHP